jgi:hypothetical protein
MQENARECKKMQENARKCKKMQENARQAGAELCQAQAKLSCPASSPSLTLKLFFQVEMNKVSG